MNRIDAKFKKLKKNRRKALIIFITSGYPSLDITYKLILEFSRIGVDIIELGVPFSDPIADGPVIQEASQAALDKKVNIIDILNLVRRARKKTDIPICLMTYYNPVFCFGEERFVKMAREAGVDGLLIPDLPPEEAGSLIALARKSDLDIVFFISPTTTQERIKSIARVSKGFIYYISLTGITGIRKSLPRNLVSGIRSVRKNTSRPVCVGFGISGPQQVKQVFSISDGAIIGSAVVKKIRDNLKNRDLIKTVGNFVSGLRHV